MNRNRVLLSHTRALALLILFVATEHASTLIIFWSPDATIIGADGKVTTLDGKDAGTGCKIHLIPNNVVWAQAE